METEEMAEELAGAILGEEQETESPEIEATETAEETPEPASEVVEEPEEEVKVPLKALQEERRKRQEYEARLKDIEDKVSATPKEQTLEDIYAADPQGTTSRINAEIARLQNDDPFANAEQIEKLRDLKVELREKVVNRTSQAERAFIQDLQREVPDLAAKQDVYTDFAIEELGYDRQTLQQLSNPALVGAQAAIKFVKSIATQHARANAAVTAKAKAVQPQPTRTEAPGTGVKTSGTDLGKLKQDAARTGDWSKYLEAAGVLD